jgi:hypothetical protein
MFEAGRPLHLINVLCDNDNEAYMIPSVLRLICEAPMFHMGMHVAPKHICYDIPKVLIDRDTNICHHRKAQ